MYNDRENTHNDIDDVSDQYDHDGSNHQRSMCKTCGHVVKALSDRESRHAYGEEPDVAHDITEAADRVQEDGKCSA